MNSTPAASRARRTAYAAASAQIGDALQTQSLYGTEQDCVQLLLDLLALILAGEMDAEGTVLVENSDPPPERRGYSDSSELAGCGKSIAERLRL
jgi:hypothetical protein